MALPDEMLLDAYRDGRDAYNARTPGTLPTLPKCPYHLGTSEERWWNRGYMDAERAAAEDFTADTGQQITKPTPMPCPFCGSAGSVAELSNHSWIVRCSAEGKPCVAAPIVYGSDEHQTINRWNHRWFMSITRHQSTPLPDPTQEVKDLCQAVAEKVVLKAADRFMSALKAAYDKAVKP